MRLSRAFAIASILATAAAGVATAAPGNAPRTGAVSVGSAAPELHTRRIRGPDPVSLEQLRGRVVILDFWATWCGPCRAVMPFLDALHRQHHRRGLSIVGISSEDSEQIDRFLTARPVGYTVARDSGGTGRRYGVRAIPTLVVVDRNGDVRQVLRGITYEQIQALPGLVDGLLGESVP